MKNAASAVPPLPRGHSRASLGSDCTNSRRYGTHSDQNSQEWGLSPGSPGSVAQASAPRAPSSGAIPPRTRDTERTHVPECIITSFITIFTVHGSMRRFVGIAFFFFYALTSIYAVEKYPDTNARRTNRSRYMHYSRLLGLPMRTLPNSGRRCSVCKLCVRFAFFRGVAVRFSISQEIRSMWRVAVLVDARGCGLGGASKPLFPRGTDIA